MGTHFYLTLIPEALVASMLPPEEFGKYMATGTEKRPHGQALFFEVKRDRIPAGPFDLADAEVRCVPHPDGQPKHSVYVAIYRVLEEVTVAALGRLYLATSHGRVLEIAPADAPTESPGNYHIYQELCPVHPLVASVLAPGAFCRFITDPARPIHVPAVCFVELDLGDLAEDPAGGTASGVALPHSDHVRSCLCELKPLGSKETKTVDRIGQRGLIYRSVRTGFYVGDPQRVLYYPYPTREELETTYYTWWRCANDAELERAAFA